MNDLGQVLVANDYLYGPDYYLWTKEDGRFETPVNFFYASDINNKVQIVGVLSSKIGAVTTEDGEVILLGEEYLTDPDAINDLGQVVGSSSSPSGNTSFLWDINTGMQDLNNLILTDQEWTLRFGLDINNKGQIAGNGLINGEQHAFLLNPLIEVTRNLEYYVDIKLGDTFSFDYCWEMGEEPEGFNLDILFFRDGQWEILGWDINLNGSSNEWQTALYMVPEELRGLETQIKFMVFDFGQQTDPSVYLRNISSAPEPSTLLLFGTGLVGLLGFRRTR